MNASILVITCSILFQGSSAVAEEFKTIRIGKVPGLRGGTAVYHHMKYMWNLLSNERMGIDNCVEIPSSKLCVDTCGRSNQYRFDGF